MNEHTSIHAREFYLILLSFFVAFLSKTSANALQRNSFALCQFHYFFLFCENSMLTNAIVVCIETIELSSKLQLKSYNFLLFISGFSFCLGLFSRLLSGRIILQLDVAMNFQNKKNNAKLNETKFMRMWKVFAIENCGCQSSLWLL